MSTDLIVNNAPQALSVEAKQQPNDAPPDAGEVLLPWEDKLPSQADLEKLAEKQATRAAMYYQTNDKEIQAARAASYYND